MKAKFSVCVQMRLVNQNEDLPPHMEFELEKYEEIPEGYPPEGMSIQIFQKEDPMQVDSANLWRNTDGKFEMHVDGFWSCNYRDESEMLQHVDKLKTQGWEITHEHKVTKTDA